MENSVNNCNNFIPSKDAEEKRVVHSRRNNINFHFIIYAYESSCR